MKLIFTRKKMQITSNTLIADERIKQLWSLVGNTPMIELHYTYKGNHGKVHVKCEHYNLTGSIKDRMALYIFQEAYAKGTIMPGDTVVEATSGNTGIAFASIGRILGHPVKIIMPDWLSKERVDIIRTLGAEVQLVSKSEGGFLGSIEKSKQLAKKGNVFLPCQFDNYDNARAHEQTTGPEIWAQLSSINLIPDAFVAGVGTGGTVVGVGNYLKKMQPSIFIHPLEPAESPTLTTGYKVGAHRIQGISDEFIPSIVNLNQLNHVIQASDGDSILMAQKLGKELGLAVGISSGANIIGAIHLQELLGWDKTIVTIFPDSNKKYLSTDLMRQERIKDSYITPHVAFTGFDAIGRL